MTGEEREELSKECWCLDFSWYKWLAARLPIYLEEAGKVIDLTYYKFNIGGKEYTQEEVIKMMIEDVNFLTSKDNDTWLRDYQARHQRLVECWSKVCRAMWW